MPNVPTLADPSEGLVQGAQIGWKIGSGIAAIMQDRRDKEEAREQGAKLDEELAERRSRIATYKAEFEAIQQDIQEGTVVEEAKVVRAWVNMTQGARNETQSMMDLVSSYSTKFAGNPYLDRSLGQLGNSLATQLSTLVDAHKEIIEATNQARIVEESGRAAREQNRLEAETAARVGALGAEAEQTRVETDTLRERLKSLPERERLELDTLQANILKTMSETNLNAAQIGIEVEKLGILKDKNDIDRYVADTQRKAVNAEVELLEKKGVGVQAENVTAIISIGSTIQQLGGDPTMMADLFPGMDVEKIGQLSAQFGEYNEQIQNQLNEYNKNLQTAEENFKRTGDKAYEEEVNALTEERDRLQKFVSATNTANLRIMQMRRKGKDTYQKWIEKQLGNLSDTKIRALQNLTAGLIGPVGWAVGTRLPGMAERGRVETQRGPLMGE